MVIQTRASSWWAVAAIAVAGSVVLGISSASAQTTYTWANSNVNGTPPANLDWFTGGPNTQGTWTGGTPVSSNLNTIRFFQDASTQLPNTAVPSTQAVNLNNGGTAFELGTLTLTGRGSATTNANLTMNLSGDALNFSAATGTINLSAINSTRTVTYNVANNIQLGTASSASNLTITGNGDNGTGFNFSGSISELQAGGGSKLIKSGTSTATITGAVTVSGGVEVNSGALVLSGSSNTITGGFTLNGGALRYTNATTVNGNNINVTGTASFLQHSGSSSTNATITLNPGSNLSLGGQDSTQTITGAVTGAGSLTVNRAGGASSTINLNNTANTFTGGITFFNIGSTLTLNVNSLVDSVGAGNIRYTGTNFTGGIASYIFNLGSGAVAPLALNNRQIEFTSTNTVGGVIGNNSSQAFTINTDLLVSSTTNPILYLGGTGSGLSSFNGLIANGTATSVALIKRDSGTWVLGNSANSYTGATRILAGTLSIGKLADFSANSSIGAAASGAIILGDGSNSGTLLYTGGEQSTNRTIQINTTANTNTGGATITNNGTGTLTFTAATFNHAYTNGSTVTRNLGLGGSSNGVIEGVIQNNSATNSISLSKSGRGTWKLSGANTFTGTTTTSGGGTLELDYTSQNNSKLADAATLTLGAGAINLVGGSHTEVVASTTLTANEGVKVNRVSGGSVLQLGAITRNNHSTLSVSADNIATTSTTNTNGILGSWATVGSNWAVNSTNGANGAIVGLTSYTALPATGGTGTVNYQLSGTQSQTGDVTTNTVRIVNSGNSDTLALGTRALNLGSGTGGLIYAGGFDDNFTISGTTGAIKSQTANNQVVLNVFTGTLTVNALLNAGSAVTSKFGAGTLVVGGSNTSSGAFYQQEGVVRLTHSNALGTTAGGVVVQNGAALELANSVAIGAEAATITGMGVSNGGALRNVASNTSSYAGAITIGAGGARITSDSGGALTLTGGVVTAIGSDVTFGGAGDTTVSTTGISGVGHVIKTGTGVLTLSTGNGQANTTVTEGQLNINHFAALGTTAGTLTMAAGTLLDNTSGTAVTVSNAKAISFGSSVTFVGSNELDLGSGIVTLSGSNTEFNIAAKTLTLSGDVVGAGYGITKTGAGTLVLDGLTGASSFTGNSFVNAGKLVITAGAVLGGGSSTVVTLGAGGFLEVDSATNLGGVSVAGNTQNLISGTIVEANQDFTINQTLSAVNRQYDGVQTIFSGVTVTTATNYLGSVPATTTPGRIVFQDNGRLKATAGFTIDSKQGITLQSGTAVFESDAPAQLLVPASVAGSGGIRKVGAGNLRLTGSNTYSGGTFIEQGIIGISYGESLGDVAGGLTIDGGTIVAAQTVAPAPSVSTVTIDPARVVRIGNGKTSGMHAQNGLTLRYDGVITEVDSVGAAGALQFGFDATREGTVILGGANTYRGDTIISHGTLKLGGGGSFASSPRIIVGDATSNSAVLDITEKTTFTIGAGQTLMGKGTVLSQPGTELIVEGLFSPGNSPELFTYDGGLTTLSGTTLFEIWGTARGLNPGYDAVNVINSATLSLGGLLRLDFDQTFATNTSFQLINATAGSLIDEFASISITGSNSDYLGLTFSSLGSGVWETGATDNDQKLRLTQTSATLALDVIAVAVPEPATIVLVASGAAILGSLLARRRRGS